MSSSSPDSPKPSGFIGRLLSFVFGSSSDNRKPASDDNREPAEPKLFWGMRELPFSDATQRFLVVGSPGSGKTTLLELLMRSVLPYIVREKFKHRALIYDAKRDMLPLLARIGFSVDALPDKALPEDALPDKALPEDALPDKALPEVRTLNPFDKRGFSWDIATDIDSPAAALQVATILIPEERRSSQPFFADASRQLLYAVFLSFLSKVPKKPWNLRHVILVLKDAERLEAVLRRSEHTEGFVKVFFRDPRVLADIMSTVATKLTPLEIVAALWHRAETEGKSLSLKSWIAGKFILVLGNHPANRAALQAINHAIFHRVTDLLLSQEEVKDHSVSGRKSWLFLDEVRDLGKLEGLSTILNQGRSKGVCTVIGFQDIEGMRHVYESEEANEIVGQCDNKTFLRTESAPTAKWAEEHFGQNLFLEYTEGSSDTSGANHTTHTDNLNEHIQLRSAVLASRLMTIPRTNPVNGLTGFHDLSVGGAYSKKLDWEEIEAIRSKPMLGRELPKKEIPGEEPRDKDQQFLIPWSPDTDGKPLGVSVAVPVPPPTPKSAEQILENIKRKY